MGWSEQVAKKELDKIFKSADRQYRIQHPEDMRDMVLVEFEGRMLSQKYLEQIVALFPEHVYVRFIPNYTIPGAETPVDETLNYGDRK